MTKPFEIRSAHGPFAIHIRAQERGAERLELRHHIFRAELQATAPAVRDDVALRSIERHYSASRTDFLPQFMQKPRIHSSFVECGASDDDLIGSPCHHFGGARDAANSAAHADVDSVFETRFSG